MIDYARLARSVEHYSHCGYTRIESPWTVTRAISDITKPPQGTDYTISEKNKVLVASGEQSFLYLALKGFLPPGRYQTITPCFRDESFDLTHTKYFMKNELIVTDEVSSELLKAMVDQARSFFRSEMDAPIHIVQTGEDQFDLELTGGMELGSYGIRKTDFLLWIYGTGCAEPRMTMAKQKEHQ